MKIDKIIFGSDESEFLEFWPLQSKVCKEILGIDPILFIISDQETDFYSDGFGTVKKVKKSDLVSNTGAQAAIGRMYFTRYFPEDVCLVSDIDLLTISKDYIELSTKELSNDSFVIFDSDAYSLDRPEVYSYLSQSHFPYIQKLYSYHFNAGKGKIFDKILGTDCTFDQYLLKHVSVGDGSLFWGVDEFYFSDCINNKSHGIEIHEIIRGIYSPWVVDRRIERHNFPVKLKIQGEIEAQNKYGTYDEEKLKEGYYIDVNCCRPYSNYKNEIDKVVEIVLKNKSKYNSMYNLGVKYETDKILHHRFDRIYSFFLDPIRQNNIKLFEIGCGRDYASFNMWKEYFPYGEIFCMDINEELISERGIVYKGDQTNIEDLKRVSSKIGKCEVIIDDGSHHPQHQIDSFNFLFNNLLKEGGIYIIEDIECSYWRLGTEIYGYELNDLNILDFFSSTPHRINQEFSNLKNSKNISSITYYKNCIIIIKQSEEEMEENKRDYRFKDRL